MDARQQFAAALNEVLAELEASGDGHLADVGFISLGIETLSETALLNGDIPMTVIDVLNQARQHLNNSTESTPYSSYAAPVLPSMGRRERPKFDITKDQLKFFRGRYFFPWSKTVSAYVSIRNDTAFIKQGTFSAFTTVIFVFFL